MGVITDAYTVDPLTWSGLGRIQDMKQKNNLEWPKYDTSR